MQTKLQIAKNNDDTANKKKKTLGQNSLKGKNSALVTTKQKIVQQTEDKEKNQFPLHDSKRVGMKT